MGVAVVGPRVRRSEIMAVVAWRRKDMLKGLMCLEIDV